MLTYTEARTRMLSAKKDVVLLERNTRLHEVRVNAGPLGIAYAVQFHETDVVTIMPGNRYALRTGGWASKSTLDRISTYSSVAHWRGLYAKVGRGGGYDQYTNEWYQPEDTSGEWKLRVRPDPNDLEPDVSHNSPVWRAWSNRQWIPFYEGIVVDADGYPLKCLVERHFKIQRQAEREVRRQQREREARLQRMRLQERLRTRYERRRAEREPQFIRLANDVLNDLREIREIANRTAPLN